MKALAAWHAKAVLMLGLERTALGLENLSVDLLVLILSWIPLSKSKLALLLVGKAWHAAMGNPNVHMRVPADCLSMGPAAPKLQNAIPVAIPALEVTCGVGSNLGWLPKACVG
eukprot:jgi/Astpho2/5841/Aster-02352